MNVSGVVVDVVFVSVALVGVMDVAGLVAVVFVGIALVNVVVVKLGVVLVAIAFVDVVDVAGLVAVVFMGVALVDIVMLHQLPPAKYPLLDLTYLLPCCPRNVESLVLLLKHCGKSKVKPKSINCDKFHIYYRDCY